MQMRVTKRGTPFVVLGGTLPTEHNGTRLCPWVPVAARGRRPTPLMQIRSTKGPLWAPQPTKLLCNGRAAPGGEGHQHHTSRPVAWERGQRDPSTKITLFSARFLGFGLFAPKALLHLQRRLLNRDKVCVVPCAGSALPATPTNTGAAQGSPKPETGSASRGRVRPTPQGRHRTPGALRLIIKWALTAPSHSLPRCAAHAALKPNGC